MNHDVTASMTFQGEDRQWIGTINCSCGHFRSVHLYARVVLEQWLKNSTKNHQDHVARGLA